MGLMARLLSVEGSKIDTKGNAPGKATIIDGELGEEGKIVPELYPLPGLFMRPPKGTRGVFLPLRGRNRYGVVIATHNYQVEFDIEEGETVVHSTNAAGDTVKAKIHLQQDGKITVTADSDIDLADGGGNTISMSGSSVVVNGNLEVLQ